MKTIRFQLASALCFATVGGLFALTASTASAQYGPAIRYGNNGTPAIYHHASTLEEGVLRGTADLARGIGDMNYSNSLALINGQEARRRAIENRRAYVETYFEVKRINRQAKAQTQRPRPTAETLVRLARESAPKNLTAGDFDPSTGALAWPAALSGDDFAAQREAIDASFGSAAGRKQVQRLAGKMSSQLEDSIHDWSPAEYMEAKKFLIGLSIHDGSSPAALAVR